MIWIIVCKDKPGSLDKRLSILEDHRKYLSTNPIKTLISGPLMNENDMLNGSFFMVEADNIDEIKIFQKNDPLFQADVWGDVFISPFNKRVDNLSS